MNNRAFSPRTLSLGFFAFLFICGSRCAWSQNTSLKVNDIPTDEDTTITIKKGPVVQDGGKAVYDVVTGSDELSSDEEYDEKKALAEWKQACADWKKEIKELNKDNQIL